MDADRLKAFYRRYDSASLSDLADVYSENVVFKDPLHEVEGLESLTRYFADGRKGLLHCSFEFGREVYSRECNTAVLEWTMCFAHSRLSSGEKYVSGCSMVEVDQATGLVVSHTDYFDIGAMIYENVPVLGRAVAFIKRKASGAK